ncbi:chemotaxis protein MotA [Desulfovibrionales bacterium]
MFIIFGSIIVLIGVVGGYLMKGGNLQTLCQPEELIIIGSATLGSFLISGPGNIPKYSLKALVNLLKDGDDKHLYMDLLLCAFDILILARREGAAHLESHVNNPDSSIILSKYPRIIRDNELRNFICDNIKVFVSSSNLDPNEFNKLMEIDISSHHTEALKTPFILNKVADTLPGLSIVTAVLGFVLTMSKASSSPEIFGHSIATAMVGTFLGILACYGFIGPIATNLEHHANAKQVRLLVIKAWLNAFVLGWPPTMAVEFARRAIPVSQRPGFDELEQILHGKK